MIFISVCFSDLQKSCIQLQRTAYFVFTFGLTSVPFRFRMYENMSTMVYLKEEKLEKLTQDEIIAKTKQVINGLEALKNEHNSILQSLLETLKCLKKDDETNLVEEKSNMIRKSLEMLELGLSEAQVKCSRNKAFQTGRTYICLTEY